MCAAADIEANSAKIISVRIVHRSAERKVSECDIIPSSCLFLRISKQVSDARRMSVALFSPRPRRKCTPTKLSPAQTFLARSNQSSTAAEMSRQV